MGGVTLKLEMVALPASVSMLLTQLTMVSSVTFWPSPRSSRMFSVYLKEHMAAFKIRAQCAAGRQHFETRSPNVIPDQRKNADVDERVFVKMNT